MKRRLFFDLEFIENGVEIDPISIGICDDQGKEYYAQFLECGLHKANDWVKKNVFPKLKGLVERSHDLAPIINVDEPSWKFKREIKQDILDFVGADTPIWYGYYVSYDWVALCQIFGMMIDLPKGWPMYPIDLKQWADSLGNIELPQMTKGEHNALNDAWWNKEMYVYLLGLETCKRNWVGDYDVMIRNGWKPLEGTEIPKGHLFDFRTNTVLKVE